jgi:hypothetical protein
VTATSQTAHKKWDIPKLSVSESGSYTDVKLLVASSLHCLCVIQSTVSLRNRDVVRHCHPDESRNCFVAKRKRNGGFASVIA